MANDPIVKANDKRYADKTDWKRVMSQTESDIRKNIENDPDCPELKNKKYTKPGKNR